MKDVDAIVEAMTNGGKEAANDIFNKLLKERKLAPWELQALKTLSLDRMKEKGLLK